MALIKGKHIVQEIDGVLCTVVETNVDSKRRDFLKELLEFNSFEVKIQEEAKTEGQETTFTIGVTNLKFNPMIAVYQKSLKRIGGGIVSPNYWNQAEETAHLPYFNYRETNPDATNDDDFLPNPWAYRTV